MTSFLMRIKKVSVFIFFFLLLGCSSVMPGHLSQERTDYNKAVSHSDDGQMLLNIVRLRNLDAPVFLQINSITSQNSLQSTASLAYSIYNPPGGGTPNAVTPGVTLTKSPTISYTPLEGEQFTRNMLSPISLLSIYYLVNAGWSIDSVFRLSLQNINEYYNEPGYITADIVHTKKEYTKFVHVLALLTQLQREEAIDFYFDSDQASGSQILVIAFHSDAMHKAITNELRNKLGLSKDANTILFTTNYALQMPNTVHVKTRSVMAVMSFLANDVQMPNLPMKQQITTMGSSLLHVKYSKDSPAHNIKMLVRYNHYYYYFDNDDEESKRIILLLRNLYELSAGLPGGTSGVVLSLPAV